MSWHWRVNPGLTPNDLSGGISPQAWNQLLQDSRHPLTNRAIQGQYPPGSTFKIVMAATLLETHTMSANDSISCHGTFPFGKRVFRDWKRGGHGSVDLTKALAESCDVYFYKAGNQLGIDPIATYSRKFGLGAKNGYCLVVGAIRISPLHRMEEKESRGTLVSW